MKRRSRDARRPIDHQRTLQLKTDSLSEQVDFPSRIFSKLSRYGMSEEIGMGVATNLFNVLTYIMWNRLETLQLDNRKAEFEAH